MKNYTLFFNQISLHDVPTVGGKNASLGEMLSEMNSIGVNVPSGFALKTNAYQSFLSENKLESVIKKTLAIKEFKQNQWYDQNEIRGKLPEKIDLIIIDGPPDNIGRSGILHNLDMFSSDSIWIIDDVLRTKDQKLANYIALHFKLIQYRFWNFSILIKNPIENETLQKINSKSLEELNSKSETYMKNYYPSMFKD